MVLPCNVLSFITVLAVRVSETDTVMSAVGVRLASTLDGSETKGDRVPVVLTNHLCHCLVHLRNN